MEFYIYGPILENEVMVAVIVPEVFILPERNLKRLTQAESLVKNKLNSNKKIKINLIELFSSGGFVKKSLIGNPLDVNNQIFETYRLHKQFYRLRIKDILDIEEPPFLILNPIRTIYRLTKKGNNHDQSINNNSSGFLHKIQIIKKLPFRSLLNKDNKNDVRLIAKNVAKSFNFLDEKKLYSEKEINDSYKNLLPYLKSDFNDFLNLENEIHKLATTLENYFLKKTSQNETP